MKKIIEEIKSKSIQELIDEIYGCEVKNEQKVTELKPFIPVQGIASQEEWDDYGSFFFSPGINYDNYDPAPSIDGKDIWYK